jgi:hypothetical protein
MVVAAVCLACAAVEAQAADCTYDRCALRVQFRRGSMSVVQGIDANPVARIGLFAPDIGPLADGPAESQAHYELFRAAQNRAGRFGIVSGTLAVAALVVYLVDTDENDGVALGLAIASIPFSIGVSINAGKARDQLEQAIWFFNRVLTRAP